MMIRIARTMASFPRDVRDGSLCDHADLFLASNRQRQLNRLLVGDIDRRLQGVERAAVHGIMRRSTIATVTDVTGETALTRGLQCFNRFAMPQLRFRTTVQLDKIDKIGLQAMEAPLHAGEDR